MEEGRLPPTMNDEDWPSRSMRLRASAIAGIDSDGSTDAKSSTRKVFFRRRNFASSAHPRPRVTAARLCADQGPRNVECRTHARPPPNRARACRARCRPDRCATPSSFRGSPQAKGAEQPSGDSRHCVEHLTRVGFIAKETTCVERANVRRLSKRLAHRDDD